MSLMKCLVVLGDRGGDPVVAVGLDAVEEEDEEPGLGGNPPEDLGGDDGDMAVRITVAVPGMVDVGGWC